MLLLCETYAEEHNIRFNSSKSQLIHFTDKKRVNNLFADFTFVDSSTLARLFDSYCMNVYGVVANAQDSERVG